jgi:hypothetical protein
VLIRPNLKRPPDLLEIVEADDALRFRPVVGQERDHWSEQQRGSKNAKQQLKTCESLVSLFHIIESFSTLILFGISGL